MRDAVQRLAFSAKTWAVATTPHPKMPLRVWFAVAFWPRLKPWRTVPSALIHLVISIAAVTIRSNVYEQKNQSTKHLYAQDLKLSSQRRHILQKFMSKSICGHQHKVQTNNKQKYTLQKEYDERLDNSNAQVTSQVTVEPRKSHFHNCDKSLAKCMYAETSNGQVPLGPNSKIFSTLSYLKD
ncbi:hypothetical protein Tco_1150229 [Tanacetum coccineum]